MSEAHLLRNLVDSSHGTTYYDDSVQVLNLEGSPMPSEGTHDDGFVDPLGLSEERTPTGETTDSIAEGVLDKPLVSSGLSNLGRTADGTHLVLLNLDLPGVGLIDIQILETYKHLQKIVLSHNSLTDLSALSAMQFMVYLDVSNNRLSHLLDFAPPKNLHYADFSFNQISSIPDLSAHKALRSLILDNNDIAAIEGLQGCHSLSKLSLSHNQIEKIQGLDGLPIKILRINSNKLTDIEGLENLKYLMEINLSYNPVTSLLGLSGHAFLEIVEVEDCLIDDIIDIQHLSDLRLLRKLSLRRNQVQQHPDYRLCVVFVMPWLTSFDGHTVTVEEKVAASNYFDPPAEAVAARDHMLNAARAFRQPPRIHECTLPSVDTPYPMLVLVGPSGCGRKRLALRLVADFPEYFGYGVCHTTRPTRPTDNDRTYRFLSTEEFSEISAEGGFVVTYQCNGFMYGHTLETIDGIAENGLACVLDMELEGVYNLKNTYFEPRYVLTLPLDTHAHRLRLRSKESYSGGQVEYIIERVQHYVDVHRQRPGFFDMMINTGDHDTAYERLKKLVLDYLGDGSETGGGATPVERRSGLMERLSSRASHRGVSSPLELDSLQRRAEAARQLTGSSRQRGPPLPERWFYGAPPYTAPAAMVTGAEYPGDTRPSPTDSWNTPLPETQTEDRFGSATYPILPPIN